MKPEVRGFSGTKKKRPTRMPTLVSALGFVVACSPAPSPVTAHTPSRNAATSTGAPASTNNAVPTSTAASNNNATSTGSAVPPETVGPSADSGAPATVASSTAALPNGPDGPPGPAHFTPHALTTMNVRGDRSIVVAHAERGNRRAIVYLHGMCSEVSPAKVWIPETLRYGTFVALRADVPCGDRPGYKWPKDPALILSRLDRALEEVRSARGGELNGSELVLIGYSQGAHRAELLARDFPARFPLLVLGGPPEAAHPENFRGAKRVAVFGGEKEDFSHMIEGQRLLAETKIPSRFFVFPGAPHGSFGPEGRARMREVLSWLFSER